MKLNNNAHEENLSFDQYSDNDLIEMREYIDAENIQIDMLE